MDRRLFFTCVSLVSLQCGQVAELAVQSSGWGWTSWVGCPGLAFLWWYLAACYPLCLSVLSWEAGTLQ